MSSRRSPLKPPRLWRRKATVVVQQVPAPTQIIQIAPVQPTVVYVPAYNPVVVYGAWPYPAYPPYPYYPPYPPGYIPSSAVWFGVGVGIGVAWGYAWGNCNWGSNSVKINYNQNININKNINRSKYQKNVNNSLPRNGGNWQHNPQHRQGVPYRDQGTSQRFGGANQSRQASQARDAYRGRNGRRDKRISHARWCAGVISKAVQKINRTDLTRKIVPACRSRSWNTGSVCFAESDSGRKLRHNAPPTTILTGALNDVDRGGSAARTESQARPIQSK